MRGKGGKPQGVFLCDRITPAYAGKSSSPDWSLKRVRDHPRLCGEKAVLTRWVTRKAGSPPPMRGKGRRCRVERSQAGITPAYAGKSTSFQQLPYSCQDHPRLCGEKQFLPVVGAVVTGSPPPMRGKVVSPAQHVRRAGITPAYAGKSYGITEVYDNKKGSPPPMRGKDSRTTESSVKTWITPAYAGKRCLLHGGFFLRSDHPRLCGEKATLVCLRRISTGSPPPMRGKAMSQVYEDMRVGITPAYAGKRVG